MPLKLDNESELREAQAALFNVNSKSGWLLVNYVGPSTVHFSAGGEGGPEDLVEQVQEDQIQYALIRLDGIQEQGETTVRDVFITFIGQGVGIIEKGKKAAFHSDAQNFLQPYHSDVTVLNRRKVTTKR